MPSGIWHQWRKRGFYLRISDLALHVAWNTIVHLPPAERILRRFEE